MAITTTAGSLLIKSLLPTEEAKAAYDPSTILDKDGVKNLMVNIIKNGGPNAHDAIGKLSHLFFNTATDKGFSTPLSDYDNDSEERNVLLKEFETKVNQIHASNKPVEEKDKALFETVGHYTGKIEKQNIEYLLSKGSTAAKMAQTGARGNKSQLRQGTSSPIMAKDVEGNFIPVPIIHSFAEGLTPVEHMAMAYEGRGNTVKTQLSTALPGAVFKHLTPNLYHEVVTLADCGTSNGVIVPLEDKKAIIGRYTAGTNRLIDEAGYKDLKGSGVKDIKMRNVMTCEAKEGVCQKCYGIAHTGKLPHIGENVGVIAAQSASEVLTQAMLSTKHTSGASRKKRDAYEETSNILANPENFQDEATISKLNGTVEKVEETALKDRNVYVNGMVHYVPNSQDVVVKPGDTVRTGQPLSTGTINPRQLVSLRGIGAGRRLMASQLRQVYGDGLDTRHFDLIAKNLIKYVHVVNPGNTTLLPGQKLDFKLIADHLNSSSETIPVKNATGKVLAEKVLELVPGTELDGNHIHYLESHGVDKVSVTKTGLIVKPIVPGLTTAKLLDKNWISRLSFSHLEKSLKEAAAEGHESDIHSTDPIASYVIGNEFGLGEHGRY